VVIGSGFGGLAAAVRLGARGYRVTVLEKLDAPGGRAYVHRQDGFTFDAGPTVVTAPFLFEELWSLAGRRMADDVDMRPVTPFYRIRFHDGETFDYTGDAEAMRREVSRLSPGDLDGYERFLRMSEEIFRVGFEQLADVPFGSWVDMARIAPDMVKLQSYRTVYGLVSKYVKDDRLRQVMSFHPLLVGGNPFSTTSIYTLTDAIRKVPTPALIICGDEDDACVEPSLFLKKHLPAAGLTLFPKSGHVLNLEEPALFNDMVERFIALAEAGRWGVRDPRSVVG